MQSSWQRNPVEWKRLVSQVSLSCSRVNSEVQSSERDGLLGQFVMQLTMTSSWVKETGWLGQFVVQPNWRNIQSSWQWQCSWMKETGWLGQFVMQLSWQEMQLNGQEMQLSWQWYAVEWKTGLVRSVCHTVKLTRNAVELTVACSWVKETGWWGHFIWYHFQFCGQGYHKDLSSPRFHFMTGVILCLTSPWYTVMVDWA